MDQWLEVPGTGLGIWDGRATALPPVDLDAARRGLARLRQGEVRSEAGRVDFFHLPYAGSAVQDAGQLERIGVWAAGLRERGIARVIWIGLGGSVLGPRFVERALRPAGGSPELAFADNLDPERFAALLAASDPLRTHVVIASKSGTTAEVAALAAWALSWLEQAGRGKELTAIAGPDGLLFDLARARGWSHFLIPPGVGGRWSVLSPVGLLAVAAAGGDPRALLDGARAADEHYIAHADSVATRYARHLGSALHSGRDVLPVLAYADRLELFGNWLQQLLMESLGKRRRRGGQVDPVGLSVIAARGTSDQHSMLQEWIDGPPRKFATFLVAGTPVAGPALAGPFGEALPALAGHTARSVQLALYAGTAEALRAAGVPSVSFVLERPDERALGALIQVCELACALVAELLDVDAYDQPAVEAGKRTARELLAAVAAGRALGGELDRLFGGGA